LLICCRSSAPSSLTPISAATGTAARGRPNLAIRAGADVDRVELHGTTARGVRITGREIIEVDAIVVTAGSYASPAILMRSGIGPAAALRDFGIGVAADLPWAGTT